MRISQGIGQANLVHCLHSRFTTKCRPACGFNEDSIGGIHPIAAGHFDALVPGALSLALAAEGPVRSRVDDPNDSGAARVLECLLE
ncbi:MAG TPA: hypothetical protein VF797_12905 [Noviherbaspirillum sp.]